MRFTIAAAAVAALVAAVPAYAADMGGPMKQNGQCWKAAKTMDGGTFGTWSACPGGAPAAAAKAPATAHHRNHS
jgi:hypothetical protein